jgi:hypothetical protein
VSTDSLEQEHPRASDLLRRTVAAVAEATAAPNRSADLSTRLEAGDHSLCRSVPHRYQGRRSARHLRPLAATAADVALLIGVVALVALRDEQDPSSDVASAPGDPGTGWFLPPQGWLITSVVTEQLDADMDGPCPCTSWLAARPND